MNFKSLIVLLLPYKATEHKNLFSYQIKKKTARKKKNKMGKYTFFVFRVYISLGCRGMYTEFIIFCGANDNNNGMENIIRDSTVSVRVRGRAGAFAHGKKTRFPSNVDGCKKKKKERCIGIVSDCCIGRHI